MPALPEDEAKRWHREIRRLGRDAVLAAMREIDPAALKIADLTLEQRERLRETLASMGGENDQPG